jgi:hypothetical protein
VKGAPGLAELRPGLYRWTSRHPDAVEQPEPGSPADWGPDVGSVAYAAPDALVLVDPLVEEGGAAEAELDALVERHGRRVAILTTLGFHRRSRDRLAERYGASTSRARTTLPRGVVTLPLRGAGETMVWLPEHAALVPGDRLLGDGKGALRLCPPSWLRYLPSGLGHDGLRDLLRPLLDLPVELVLVSHGQPVLADGRAALAAALLEGTEDARTT